MHDPSTESCKSWHSKGHSLEYLDPVVASFDISIRIWIFEGVEDLLAPVLVGEGHLDELLQAALLGVKDPLAEPAGGFLTILTCFHILKLLLQIICPSQRL